MSASLVVGDAREALASLPARSVDLVVTSPPFLSLRSYLPADHADKALEIGSESTPGEFLDTLLDVVEACGRVLALHGSICVELGDSYSGSGGGGGDYNPGGMREGQPKWTGTARRSRRRDGAGCERTTTGGIGWPLAKSACAIPELFHVALSYGLNPLTGRTTDKWIVRNFVAWCRPNPTVGEDFDKFRRATSFITVATKAADRYWDGYAARVRSPGDPHASSGNNVKGADKNSHRFSERRTTDSRPMYDWWTLSTQGYTGSHYATFPESLVVPLIASMCPEKVCRACGEPSRRIVERANALGAAARKNRAHIEMHSKGDDLLVSTDVPARTEIVHKGWTDCGHGDWRPGVVLDPFAGSGTTLQVATRMGRDAVGIDLDDRNESLISERVGMFMGDVTHLRQEVPA